MIPSLYSFPLFLPHPSSSSSYLSTLHPSSALFSRIHRLLSVHKETPFLGKNLSFHQTTFQFGNLKKTLFPFRTISGVVKRRKEVPLHNVIQQDKKLKLVLKIRSILVNQPDRIMNLRDFGRFRRHLGFTRNHRFIALLKRFPAVFDIVEEGVYSLKFRLTPMAKSVYLEELCLL